MSGDAKTPISTAMVTAIGQPSRTMARSVRDQPPPSARDRWMGGAPVERRESASPPHIITQVTALASPPPAQAEGGKAETAKDQRPAEQGVERDPADAQPQHDPRPLERRHEVAQQLEQQPRRGAPHVGAKERLALAGQLFPPGRSARMNVADVPQQQPVGRHRHESQQPQARAKGAAHVAHRIGAQRQARSPSSAKRR